jgi:hypothetical protein
MSSPPSFPADPKWYTSLIGAMILSRVADEPSLSDEILETVEQS